MDALRSARLPEIPVGLRDGLAPLLPELSDEHPGLEDTTRLYDAVVALLRHLARRAPLLLTIDDVHWLDERSVGLLHYTVRNLRGSVPLLVSSRPSELTDNPACRRMLEALRRAGAVDDLAVGPLPDAAIHELIRRAAPRADPNPIARASNGNPLLALEMARAVLRGDDPLSGQVDALIGDRLARLSQRAAALVALVRRVRPQRAPHPARRRLRLERRGVARAAGRARGTRRRRGRPGRRLRPRARPAARGHLPAPVDTPPDHAAPPHRTGAGDRPRR